MRLGDDTFHAELVNEGGLEAHHYSTVDTLAMSAGSTLRILGNAAFSGGGVGSLTVTSGFTNEGLIELDSIGSGQSFRDAVLIVTSGTFTNAPGGVIRTLPGIGGSRILEAQIDNHGLLEILAATSVRAPQDSRFNNLAGGMVEMRGDLTFAYTNAGGPMLFHNMGTLRKSTGAEARRVTADLLSEGTVTVLSGTLRLSGALQNWVPGDAITGNALNGGSWVVSTAQLGVEAATLQIDGIDQVHVLSGASLTLDGPNAQSGKRAFLQPGKNPHD